MTDMQENSQHGHVFRRWPFHRRRAYWLNGNELHWRIGSRQDHVSLTDVVALRLHIQAGGNIAEECVLRESSGRVHKLSDIYWPRLTREEWRKWGRVERCNPSFRALTFTLARRLKKANPSAILKQGPGRTEWVATLIVALAGVAVILTGAILMIVNRQLSLAALCFMGVVAVQLPLIWPIIRSGGPRPLDPDTLHDADTAPGQVEK